MRAVDADELKKHQFEVYQANGLELVPIMVVPAAAIDNAQTVEVPENQVNCVLTMFGKCSYNETGCSDCEIKDKIRKALNERPQGEWIAREDMDYLDENKVVHKHFQCNNCGLIHDFIDGHTSQYNFCPNCGAICSYSINVNRDELIKALNYDREQYKKGFEDGKNELIKLFNKYDILLVHIDGKIVPVKNSTKQECYNLLYEIQELIEWRKLLFNKHLSEVQDENND